MKLSAYTRRLEECRKRWNRRSVQYVLESARIFRAARKAAKDERRWGEWIRNEIHMNRATVYRHLRVAEFLKTNVALRQHLVSLSIAKLYALSRIHEALARNLVRSGKAKLLNDVAFLQLIGRLEPKPLTRDTLPNITKSIHASLARLDRSIKRWQHSDLIMPLGAQLKIMHKLHAMQRALNRIRTTSSAAM